MAATCGSIMTFSATTVPHKSQPLNYPPPPVASFSYSLSCYLCSLLFLSFKVSRNNFLAIWRHHFYVSLSACHLFPTLWHILIRRGYNKKKKMMLPNKAKKKKKKAKSVVWHWKSFLPFSLTFRENYSCFICRSIQSRFKVQGSQVQGSRFKVHSSKFKFKNKHNFREIMNFFNNPSRI